MARFPSSFPSCTLSSPTTISPWPSISSTSSSSSSSSSSSRSRPALPPLLYPLLRPCHGCHLHFLSPFNTLHRHRATSQIPGVIGESAHTRGPAQVRVGRVIATSTPSGRPGVPWSGALLMDRTLTGPVTARERTRETALPHTNATALYLL